MKNKKPHILIVDDNAENIRVLGAALSQKEYIISIATNGKMALKMAEDDSPDLILLDVMMPDMNGFDVCEILKANPKTKEIEIIFVTAAITPEDELKGLALGAVDYIHKPFSIPIIQTKAALHLERVYNKRLRNDIEIMSRHDLKTPLSAIICYPELMLHDSTLSARYREYLEEILKAGKEMLYMINNSLDLFKMETDCYQYEPDWVDLTLIINSVISDLTAVINQYSVSINLFQKSSMEQQPRQSSSFMVLAEKNLSYSLFANLICNAIEACSSGDTISIVMSNEDNEGIISIINPGSVPVEIRDSFFEKYVTAGKKQGSGLGTYSAKLMTTTQNGTISMTSNDKETCVTVKLPTVAGVAKI